MWVDADDYVEVWGESNSICGVIEDECEELTVALYLSGRFRFFSIGWCRFSRFPSVGGAAITIELPPDFPVWSIAPCGIC